MELVDVKVIAKTLGVTPSWVYSNIKRQVGSRQIPHLRAGKLLRFNPRVVMAWLISRQDVDGRS